MKNKEMLSKMTLEEKVGICSGKDFWHLKDMEKLGIPELMLTDGPHGLRKKNPEGGEKSGLNDSVQTTCFPTAVTTACSWDPELLYEMGVALGEECLSEKVSVILGPGVNMKRSPLCGRNFEYFSEDPLLAGEMAASLINGVQSKNVGTSIKHFAVNSQEKRRMTINSVVDERTLREIYLPAFEIAVKKAQPWTVMNAYNRINGTYCSENDYLQNKILRDEWGFEGIVVTDWGAANDRVLGMKNGNELEMPSSGGYNDQKVVDAVKNGELDEAVVDKCADRMLTLINKSIAAFCDTEYDKKAHHELAAKIHSESAVLLKNDENILPVAKSTKLGVIGEMARAPRFQGAGSSIINPTEISDALEALKEMGYECSYAPGYDKKKDVVSDVMVEDACKVAADAEAVLVFIGLTEEYESEGYDRSHLNLPKSHNHLLEEVIKVNKNVVVVLSGGSPVEMPWISDVKAVLNGYLGGQASGIALARLISGEVNPSGKLAETYPLCLSDVANAESYPGMDQTAEHRDGIYIGYRYYDTAKKDVLFPFGFGLSYTKFEYSDLKVSAESIKDTDTVTVSYKIKNVGDVAGAEASQVYVRDCESTIFRPEKELKGFKKVFLQPGEEKEVEITLCKRAFAYYNINIMDWHVETGKFEILVGASSRDIRLTKEIEVISTVDAVVPDYTKTAPSYYGANVKNVPDSEYEALLGYPIPASAFDTTQKLTIANSLGDAKHTKWGGRINGLINSIMDKISSPDDPNGGMMKAMALEIPIKNFISMSGGIFNEKMAEGLLLILNDEKPVRGMGKIIARIPAAALKVPALIKSI